MSETPARGQGFGGRSRSGAAVTGDAVSAWFVREILPLEANLMNYLRRNWHNASDIPDLRQEVYTRVFEAAQERIPDNPEHFLLVCARNLLINLVRREQVVPIEAVADLEALNVATDAPEPDRVVMAREELRRLEAAMAHLPGRTREAVRLAYFEGLSGKEVAARMGVTKSTASQHLAHGALILAGILSDMRSKRSAGS